MSNKITDYRKYLLAHLVRIARERDRTNYRSPQSALVTTAHVREKLERQGHRCFYTGVPMTLEEGNRLTQVSIDRLNSGLGYTVDNTVLCALGVNLLKSTATVEQLHKFLSSLQQEAKCH